MSFSAVTLFRVRECGTKRPGDSCAIHAFPGGARDCRWGRLAWLPANDSAHEHAADTSRLLLDEKNEQFPASKPFW